MWLKTAAFVTLMMAIVAIASVYGKEENNQEEQQEEQLLEQSASVMVDSQKVINNIAQEFVCFSAKPRTVFEDALNPISETTFKMAKQLSPSYLKVYADSSQMELQMEAFSVREEQTELIQITPNGWRAFDKWAQEAGMVPIFVLDYSGDSWKPNSALKVLMVANSLGITNCLWQLGTGNITNAVKYVEDLRAFRAITKAFKYKGVVACDVDPMTVGLDQTRYFNLNVEELADAVSVPYEQNLNQKQLNEFVLQREAYVRGPMRSQLPVWLDVKAPPAKGPSSENCNENCLQNGLQYATLLGDAARNGFNTVFKTLSRQEVQSYSLTYVIGLLHKTTIGTKVFEVSQIYEENLKIYAYCSRNGNGSLTLMAVNQQSEDLQFEMQLATKQQSAEVQQYVITVADQVIQLNDRPFYYESQLKPLAKTRSISKGLQLLIPGRAIAFWVIPNLNLRQCYEDYQNLQEKFFRTVSVQENSVDKLLQELIAERAEQQQQQQEQEKLEQKIRQKRSVTTDQLEEEVGMSKKTREQRGVKAKGMRSPRQTLNYRRKERTVRLKEKRAERRQLKQIRRPLRERGKRQSRKHNRCDNPSKITPSNKKTKRSSLAEAVNQPPMFGDSYEDQINRSSFPQGDVHLVISKGIQEDDPLSVEHAPMKERHKKRQKKIQQRNSSAEKDLRFFVPEVALIKDLGIPRPELVAAESIHHEILLGEPEENTSHLKSLSIDPKLVQVRDIQEEIRAGAPLVKRESLEADEPTDLQSERDNAAEEEVDEEEKQSSTSASGEDIGPADHSLGDSPEVDRSVIFSDEDDSEDSSEAYVERLDRRKRSLPSLEVSGPDTSSSNNTKWAEKLQDLIKSYGNLKSEARVKRNALLHPRSWESRANLLHRQQTSGEESTENMILGDDDAMKEVRKIREDLLATKIEEQSTTEIHRRATTVPKENDSDRLTVMTMRSVAHFVRSMSNEFNRMLSRWLPKSKEKLSA